MTAYELVCPFGVDGDELAGLTPQQCFTLGYELARVRHVLSDQEGEVLLMVHARNSSRIRAVARRAGRRIRLDPAAPGWRALTAPARPASGDGHPG